MVCATCAHHFRLPCCTCCAERTAWVACMATARSYQPRRLRNQARAAWLFLLPSLLLLTAFVVWPILQAFWMSLFDWKIGNQPSIFLGLANYQELLGDERVWNALWNTLYYTAIFVPLRLGLALVFALILNERLAGRTVYRALLFLPVIGSIAIEAIIWSFLMDPDIGMFSYYARLLGLPVSDWTRSPTWAMPAVIIVSTWRWFGFTMVVLLAGLQSISETLYEAAKVDGAGRWARFRYITLPMLRPTLLFVLVDSVIASFQVFDVVYVLTRGGPMFRTETVLTYIYTRAFEQYRMGYAASISVVLFLLIFVLTVFQLRILRFREAD